MYLNDYEKYYKEYEKALKKINDYSLLIEESSKFNLESIGNVLARIVTEVEGRDFIFKKYVYIDEAKSDSPYYCLNLIVEKEISEIRFSTETYMRFSRQRKISKRDNNAHVSFSPIFDKSRNIFILNEAKKLTWFDGYSRTVYHPERKEYFKFYDFNLNFRDLRLYYKNINFLNFSYLQDFINYVIDYRVHNNIEEISEDELNQMANQFINWHKSEEKTEKFVMRLERK